MGGGFSGIATPPIGDSRLGSSMASGSHSVLAGREPRCGVEAFFLRVISAGLEEAARLSTTWRRTMVGGYAKAADGCGARGCNTKQIRQPEVEARRTGTVHSCLFERGRYACRQARAPAVVTTAARIGV